MNLRNALFVLPLAGLLACGASVKQLQSRAAFDLDCPEEQLQVTEIDSRTRGVSGCGKKAVYIESCATADGRQCTWVLNADTKEEK